MKPTKPRRQPGGTALMLLVLASPGVLADGQDPAMFSEADFYAAIPEVVSATRITQKLTEAPASISLIDRDMIRASGALNIPDLLRLVPGFQAFHVNGNKFGATYHGVSDDFPRRLEVLVDGRSVYLPLLSTVDWNSLGLSLDDIERIEVVRGSNVPTHGSNAFLGAINIVTRSPYSETGTSLKVLGGSRDTRRVEGRFSMPLGNAQLRVTAGHDQNDGSDRFQDGARSEYFNLSGTLAPTLADTVLMQAGFSSGYADRGDMDSTDKPVVARDTSANYQYLRWNHIGDNSSELQLSAYHNYLDLSIAPPTVADLVEYEGLPAGFAAALLAQNPDFRLENEHGKTELYDIEVQHTQLLMADQATAVWGLGYRQEIAESGALLQERGRINEERWRLFSNLELVPTDAVTLNLGAMLESSTTSPDSPKLSPRLALNYRPDKQSVIRTAFSEAYRMPSLLEENAQSILYDPAGNVLDTVVVPNSDIAPERVKTAEIGYYRAFQAIAGHFDLRVFVEDVDSAISSYWLEYNADASDNRVRYSANNASWRNSGAEFQLRLQPVDRFWLLFNYAYLNTTDYWRDFGTPKGGLLRASKPQSPLHTASMLLNYNAAPGWDLSLAQYYMDEVEWDEGGNRERYNRTDLRLAKEWSLPAGQRLSGALIFQNLLGNRYSEFYQFNEFDQRTYLQLQLEF
ncbi:TonB-dependent receptor plug domain-containing protein [Marinobacterium rhizophilum]|uniref:TonB-dependent receptor n=1 Tax=Marinobacterium rhizophilum TaxID=420402 RepID=A0ABY5HGK9_9GAMM|nr:TonB-dependent receptor [Marinobacterium rhizophilum]UTW11378.1 TonB-dependent receptor [Marinobacterium rhizophilum]